MLDPEDRRGPGVYTPSIRADVVVPVAQAAAIGVAVGLLSGVTVAAFGAQRGLSVQVGTIFGLSCFTVSTVVFVLQHRRYVTDPFDLIWERFRLLLPVEDVEADTEKEPIWRTIRPRSAPPTMTIAARSPKDADTEIVNLYNFITAMWGIGSVSQAECRKAGWTRRYWDRYVGGKRNQRGTEAGRGLLDRAGVVQKDGVRWVIAATLEEALSWNRDLLFLARMQGTVGASAEKIDPSPTQDKQDMGSGV